MNPREVVILAGARTGMCRYSGLLRDTSAIDLGAVAARGQGIALIVEPVL